MRITAMFKPAAVLAAAFFFVASSATAAVITQWTFEPGTAGNPPIGHRDIDHRRQRCNRYRNCLWPACLCGDRLG